MDLGALVQTSPHAVLVLTADGVLSWANDAARDGAAALLGRPLEPGEPLLPLLAPKDRDRAHALLRTVAEGRSGGPVHLPLDAPAETWVAVRGAPAGDGLVQVALVDTTEAVLGRRRLRQSERRFRAAFEVGLVAKALLDVHGRFVLVNAAFATLLGCAPHELVGRTPAEVVHEDDLARLARSDGARKVPLRLRRSDGEVRHVLVTTSTLDDEDGPLVFLQVEDVTEAHHSEQRLRHLALHDGLTDLPGRPLVLSRLEGALDRPGQGLVAVLFVDLDGFKLVNDALGHAAGDRVLVEAAARLRDAVRPGDTVGRFGGDEFLVVCPGLASREDGVAVAQRVERAIGAPFPYSGDEVLVSASVGVAFADPSDEDVPTADELVHDADTAMYRAKQLGKRRFEVFDSAMRERAAERARVEQVLARAVLEDRVLVHYQPVVDLASRRVVGFEGLLRVRDDDGRLLLPADFLDVAQESGLLADLDDVVLGIALRDAASWQGLREEPVHLSVNVCAQQVNGELPGKVDAALVATGFPAALLTLELTEQALVSSAPAAGLALQRVVDRGVNLAIDDFGTGWASLTYLRRFPARVVKVDRSFVAGLPHEQDDLTIVRAVVDLAKQLGLACVAEGVEDEEQYAVLRGLEPPFAQGYLFGPPVPAGEVPALLRA